MKGTRAYQDALAKIGIIFKNAGYRRIMDFGGDFGNDEVLDGCLKLEDEDITIFVPSNDAPFLLIVWFRGDDDSEGDRWSYSLDAEGVVPPAVRKICTEFHLEPTEGGEKSLHESTALRLIESLVAICPPPAAT